MSTKRKKRKLMTKKLQKGTVGYFFIFGMVAFLIVMGLTIVGGIPKVSFPEDGKEVGIITPPPDNSHNSLQLRALGYVTLAPTPLPGAALCKAGGVNSEPEILVGYEPDLGKTVGATGQIKVWVNDEQVPIIAPNETVDTSTGKITTPGDRAAKAPDNFLWEPALYIAPQTADTNGTPHFPDFIKGRYNNTPPASGIGVKGATIDPAPLPAKISEVFTSEYIWNVSSLGLAKGSYQAQFLVHDGDTDRGIGCVTINIQ